MVDRLTEIGGAVFQVFAKEYGLFYVRGNLTYSSVQDLQTYTTDVAEYTYSGDLVDSAERNDTTYYFSHNSFGCMTYDGISQRTIQYSYIGFPAKILDYNNTVLAEYCYLADGTKLSKENTIYT